ncbi:PadR family transcriptional regulator [Xylanibacillus composti]|uniref:PadR family transcriptional regulator n=1 Tax=Xylanibacillus composti TaxID=1572762 RepID=A0A8J4H600_9BACL|nr:PadR family transcriptional regulator [Xylanibacillus composti]GIQ70270.1 PadR family transcriptional regulator [Xylanibacillus composti]
MKYPLLGFLSLQPMTGYELKKMVSISTGQFYSASYGSIYPTLRKLEQEGAVTSNEGKEGNRVKIVYAITAKGEQELDAWLEQSGEEEFVLRYEYMTKLFFSGRRAPANIMRMIQTHVGELEAEKQKLVELRDALDDSCTDAYQRYPCEFGIALFDFLQEWNSRLMQHIERNDGN